MRVKGERKIFMHKPNKSGVDVVAFELWKDVFVEATAVAALEITEFHDGEGCGGITQCWLPLQQQRAGQRGDLT